MKKFKKLLNLEESGTKCNLYTGNSDSQKDCCIANEYNRVVLGQRGAYVEFTKDQIFDNKLYIPKSQLFRLSDPRIYYIEFRTIIDDVKVYYQMRNVAYADYLINYFYIDANNLYTSDNKCCMMEAEDFTKTSEEFFDFAV